MWSLKCERQRIWYQITPEKQQKNKKRTPATLPAQLTTQKNKGKAAADLKLNRQRDKGKERKKKTRSDRTEQSVCCTKGYFDRRAVLLLISGYQVMLPPSHPDSSSHPDLSSHPENEGPLGPLFVKAIPVASKSRIERNQLNVTVCWDSMSSVNVINLDTFRRLQPLAKLRPTECVIRGVGGRQHPMGKADIWIRIESMWLRVTFQIVRNIDTKVLLSYKTMRLLSAVLRLDQKKPHVQIGQHILYCQAPNWKEQLVHFTRAQQRRVLQVTGLDEDERDTDQVVSKSRINEDLTTRQRAELMELLQDNELKASFHVLCVYFRVHAS